MRAGGILCAACVLFGGAAARVEAAVADYLGKPVASVRLVLEGRESDDPSLAEVVETRVGQPLSMIDVRESITHLFSLGRFEDVRVDAILANGRVALRYDLSPVHPVRKIEFAGPLGVAGVDVGRLRRAIVDRYGSSPPLGRQADLKGVIADTLRERGYLHPAVTPRADISHAPERAVLVFTIDPGPRTRIGRIDVVGTPGVSRAALLNQLRLAPGTPYEREALNARLERYVAQRRRRGYYEAQVVPTVELTDNDRLADLTLAVSPGPHVRVRFTGDSLPADRRADLVPVEREGSVDEDLLEDSSNRIEEYLHAQGYREAVAPHTREEANGELLVTFAVRRGPQYVVDQIEISGNASIPLPAFEPLLRMRAGQPFSAARLDADVSAIEELYHRRGFAAARVQSAVEPRPVRGASEVPILVRIVVSENAQTTIGAVTIAGNDSVPAAALRTGLGLQPGQPYFDAQLRADRDAIQMQYANLGYEMATVEADPHFSADRTRADPVFTIREGPRLVVDHVLIVGNVRTRSETIARELQLKPGDPLSIAAVNESQRRLAALGLFRRSRIVELRHGNETKRDLLVTVEEAPATTVGYGGGFEVRLRVVRSAEDFATQKLEFAPRASFEIGRRNLFGKNRSINLFTSAALLPRDLPVFAGQSATASSGYGLTEYRVLGQYREPRVFGSSADGLVTGTVQQQVRSSFNFQQRGMSTEIARHLTREVSLSGSYQLQWTRVFDESINPADKSLIDRLFPNVVLSSFSTSVVRDTRDDPVEPTRGTYASANGQLAARTIGSEVGFEKTFASATLFRVVPRTNRIVFAGRAELGLASGFPRTVNTQTVEDLPPSERFFAGGDTTVRGFALDTLGTPETIKGGFPIGGNALVIFNAELRAPVRGGLGVVGFFDTGNVFLHANDIDLTELRSAIGFGVRYKSPVGPIRVDLGFKVHRHQIAPGQLEGLTALHISLGQAF